MVLNDREAPKGSLDEVKCSNCSTEIVAFVKVTPAL
jgi:hypothetical protein